jgi:hypothetical protein
MPLTPRPDYFFARHSGTLRAKSLVQIRPNWSIAMRQFAFLAVVAAALAFTAPAQAQIRLGANSVTGDNGYFQTYPPTNYNYANPVYANNFGFVPSGIGRGGYGGYYPSYSSRFGTRSMFNSSPRMSYSQRNNYYNYYNRGYHGTGYGGHRR